MEAGLFYTAAGPWLAAAAFLALVFVAFRHPVGGVIVYVGLVYVSHYFTYLDELQGIVAAAGAGCLLSAALIRRPPAFPLRLAPPDWAMLAFVALMAIAAIRGLTADHARGHLAADVYHYLLVAPVLYVVARRLIRDGDVERLLGAFVWLSAAVAALAVVLIATASGTELLWLVGAPLDEGGVRLKQGFDYPMVPAIVAVAGLLVRPRPRLLVAAALLAAALVLTYKRTFWGGTLIGSAFVLGLAASHSRRRLFTGGLAAMLALAIGIGLAVAAGLNTESAIERSGGLARPTAVSTVGTRSDELSHVLAHVRAAPLGYGLGAAPVIPFADPDGRPTHYTHTIYLQWCIQGGIPAAIAGVALLLLVVRGLVRRRDEPAAIALAGAIVALAATGFALQSLNSPISALVIGLGATMAATPPRDRR